MFYKALGVMALIFFGVGLYVHVSTFFPNGYTMSQAWPLHLFAMGFAGLAAAKASKEGKEGNSWDRGPYPLRMLIHFTFIYTFVNFALFMFMAPNGMSRDNGHYYTGKGSGRHEVSAEQYQQAERVVLRGFSGHWQLFFLGSALMLLYPPDRKPQDG